MRLLRLYPPSISAHFRSSQAVRCQVLHEGVALPPRGFHFARTPMRKLRARLHGCSGPFVACERALATPKPCGDGAATSGLAVQVAWRKAQLTARSSEMAPWNGRHFSKGLRG